MFHWRFVSNTLRDTNCFWGEIPKIRNKNIKICWVWWSQILEIFGFRTKKNVQNIITVFNHFLVIFVGNFSFGRFEIALDTFFGRFEIPKKRYALSELHVLF